MKRKILTIIIPCFNSAKKISPLLISLKKIIRSNIGQAVEIIFIDDGSKDGTKEYIKKWFINNTNVSIFTQKNRGVSYTRNEGIKWATGKYITFIDSDDNIIVPNFLKIFDLIKNSNVDILNVGAKVKKEHIEKSPQKIIPSILNIRGEYTFGEYHPGPVSKFYKLDFLRKNAIFFPENLNNGEDMQFNMDCLIKADSVYFYPLPIYLYRVGQLQSLTSIRGNSEFYEETKEKIKYLHYLQTKSIINEDEYIFAITDVILSKFILLYGFTDEKEYLSEENRDINKLKKLLPIIRKKGYINNFKYTKQVLLFILVYSPKFLARDLASMLTILKNKQNKRKVRWLEI